MGQKHIVGLFFIVFLCVLMYGLYVDTHAPHEEMAYEQIDEEPALSVPYIETSQGEVIEVEVAATPRARTQGLSGRMSLEEGHGMLFVFPRSGLYSFWMPDMYFAIDIIWINEEYEVVHIEENVTPETYPESFISDDLARFVLELSTGGVDKYDLKEGETVGFKNVPGFE